MSTPNRQSLQSLTLLEVKQDLLLVRHKSQLLHCSDSCDGYSGLKVWGGGGLSLQQLYYCGIQRIFLERAQCVQTRQELCVFSETIILTDHLNLDWQLI